MATVSIDKLVIFIASLLVAATVASTLTASVVDLDQTLQGSGLAAADKIETDVDIVGDTGSDAFYNDSTGNVTLLVKNTGQKDLYAQTSQIDVFIDGQYATVDALSRPDNATGDVWAPGEILRLTLSHTLDAGEHTISVHVVGDEETVTVYV